MTVGGLYIPLVNAQRILRRVIEEVIGGETNFNQTFSNISTQDIEKDSSFNYSNVEHQVDRTINECKTMNDIGILFEKMFK